MPPIAPETTNNSVNCGICEKNCPTKSIDAYNCKVMDATRYIKCRSCVRRCPLKAKEINHPTFKNMQNKLITNLRNKVGQPKIFIV